MRPNLESESESVHYLLIYHFFPISSWMNCNENPVCDTASKYDILNNPLQVPHAGASSEIDVNNLYKVSAARESAVTELHTLLCVAQKKLRPSALGIPFLSDFSRAVTF